MSQRYLLPVRRPVVQCLDAGRSYTAKMHDLAQLLIEAELATEDRARPAVSYHLSKVLDVYERQACTLPASACLQMASSSFLYSCK